MTWALKEYAGPGPLEAATDRTALIRSDMGSIRLASHAFRGEATDSGANLDDDAATRSFPILKQWAFTENASGLEKVIWSARMIRPGIHRGDHFVGDARQYDLNWVDRNWDLTKLRVEADRPEETDVARVQWLGGYILNGSASTVTNARKRASTVIDVATYVPNTNTVTMPAKALSAMDPWAVVDDCARASGKSWFVYVDDAGALYLFYDLETSIALACTLSITDQDPDYVTEFGPDPDATGKDLDGTEFLTGGAHAYGDGTLVTQFDATAESTYDVAEDTLYADAETEAEAQAKLDALIAERKVPEPQQRTRIWVPAEQAHLVRSGMMISFRSAAAGVTAPTTYRITRVEHMPPPANGGLYGIGLELSYPKKMAPRLQDRGRIEVIARQAAQLETFGNASTADAAQQPTGHAKADLTINNQDPTATWLNGIVDIESGVTMVTDLGTGNGCSGAGNHKFSGESVHHLGVGFAIPAEVDSIVAAELTVILADAQFGGSVTSGPHLLYGGFKTAGTLAGNGYDDGIPLATGVIGDTLVVSVPRWMLNFGAWSFFKISPQWRLAALVACCGGSQATCPDSGFATWSALATSNLVLKKLQSGTAGWITAGPSGTQDGVNTSFTLIGGYEEVSDVYLNGLAMPSSAWSASGTPTLATIGWAPGEKDLFLVRYRVPEQP